MTFRAQCHLSSSIVLQNNVIYFASVLTTWTFTFQCISYAQNWEKEDYCIDRSVLLKFCCCCLLVKQRAILKFIFSKKTTKFDETSPSIRHYVKVSKSWKQIMKSPILSKKRKKHTQDTILRMIHSFFWKNQRHYNLLSRFTDL